MASSLDDDAAAAASSTESQEKKPSRLATAWTKLGLDGKTIMMMIKGSIAPTVAIAMYQSNAIASQYSTLGYLVAIMSLLGFPIMPRGMFIQTMSLNLVATGLGAAVNLLALYSATQARAHTTNRSTPLTAYNSSASAVCAIWLCLQIYLVNYLRAARPQFQFPAIIYSIFCMVSMTYGPSFPTMTAVIQFMKMLLEAFLTGFALAIAVNFLVFPVTSRQVVCAEFGGYLMSITGALKSQNAFMQHLEDIDPVAARKKAEAMEEEAALKKKHKGSRKKKAPAERSIRTSAEGLALKASISRTMLLHSKINGDLVTAHREFALGKLSQKDLSTFWKKCRSMLTPLMGMMSIMEHLKHFAEDRHFASTDLTEEEQQRNKEAVENLHITAKAMHAPLEAMTETLSAGLMHVSIVMEFTKPPKKKPADAEQGETDAPGSIKFTESFRRKLHEFETSKQVTLREWCIQKGIEDPDTFLRNVSVHSLAELSEDKLQDQFQRQLLLVLYLEYLLLRIGNKVLDLILFADQLRQDGKFKRKRLIFPGGRTVRKWIRAVFGKEDMTQDDHLLGDMDAGAAEAVDLGTSFGRRKDPEHLPPRNFRERVGESIRLCPKFFRSEYSSFAFRTMCATMSIAIVAYLQVSQQFFMQQRLLWALIMVAISMSRTAGQSTFQFALRIIGTIVAMVGAYVIWYIVDGRTPGVIVFLWVWILCGFYVVLKFPKLIIVGILGIVTTVLIIGYELQVQKLGRAASESNGQPAYDTYLLAPYRLACVVGGLFVAWIWTIWPFPVSEHSELRKDIAATLYLLANFYSNVHETVQSTVRGTVGDASKKGSHAYLLEKAKTKVLAKILAVLTRIQTNAGFAKFQVVVGGRFPSEEYDGMVECVRHILVSTALIGHAADTLAESSGRDGGHSEWFKDFSQIANTIASSAHGVTSTLSLLSSSLATGQPLPPYLESPKPFEFVRKLEAIDKTILSAQHINEPEYSAFVVIQLCSAALHHDLDRLKRHVTTLVGEIDFSFHVPLSSTSSSLSSTKSNVDDSKEQ